MFDGLKVVWGKGAERRKRSVDRKNEGLIAAGRLSE
jgi:hypothetical protein